MRAVEALSEETVNQDRIAEGARQARQTGGGHRGSEREEQRQVGKGEACDDLLMKGSAARCRERHEAGSGCQEEGGGEGEEEMDVMMRLLLVHDSCDKEKERAAAHGRGQGCSSTAIINSAFGGEHSDDKGGMCAGEGEEGQRLAAQWAAGAVVAIGGEIKSMLQWFLPLSA